MEEYLNSREVRGRAPLSLALVDCALQFEATGHLLTQKRGVYASIAKKEILIL